MTLLPTPRLSPLSRLSRPSRPSSPSCPASRRPRRAARGVSLIESALTLAVTGALVGTTLPGMQKLVDARRLESATAQLESELQFARSLAVARNDDVRLRFVQAGGGSCYVIHTGPSGACTCAPAGSASCGSGAELVRSAHFEPGAPVQVRSGTASFGFEPVRGMVTPTATITLTTRDGQEQRLVVNIMGRVRSCTNGAQVPGTPQC
jgi:type IV fimbrial biogenesis protein FimT